MPMAVSHAMPAGDGRIFQRLRAARLRPTSARICILQVLDAGARTALHAETICQQLAQMGIAVSLGTIYRVLKEMEQAGLLLREREASASGNKARYLIKPDHAEADSCYPVCRVCERSVLVQDTALVEQLCSTAGRHGMEIGARMLSVQLRCSSCADHANLRGRAPLKY